MLLKPEANVPMVGAGFYPGEQAMLQSFRNFFQSKWGVAFTLGFVGLIAFAFASGDVANMGGLGSAGGRNTVAKVGKEKIEDAEVERSIQTILGRMRQQDPTVTMASFLGWHWQWTGLCMDLSCYFCHTRVIWTRCFIGLQNNGCRR